jgi:protein TonB
MRATPVLLCLFGLAVLAGNARAAGAEGCADLKALPRLEGCIIQECSAKQHDSFDALLDGALSTVDGSAMPLDASVNVLTYTCPAYASDPSADVARVKRDLDLRIKKAGYQNVVTGKAEGQTDPANAASVARKGSQWLRWNAITEDGTVSYSLASAGPSVEACGQAPALASLKQCMVLECASKAEDSVAMRTAEKGETSLTGNVQTVTLACPTSSAVETLSKVEGELASSGFEILFHDRARSDSGFVTARSGKRWIAMVGAMDGESVSYTLTVVPAADVLTATTVEPSAVAASEVPTATAIPAPAPASTAVSTHASSPVASQAETPTVATITPTPAPARQPSAPAVTAVPQAATVVPPSTPLGAPPSAQYRANFTPPKPILQVPIEATHDRIYSVMGDVAIDILVDVAEDGTVTKAELTGRRITKDVRKLESAALEAVSHWRFEPARQDGRVVVATNVPVVMHFHGRPWRF